MVEDYASRTLAQIPNSRTTSLRNLSTQSKPPISFALTSKYIVNISRRLLKTGMFSDVTLQLGNGEEFAGHSVMLKQNSKWFADNYAGQLTMNIEDVARDPVHSVFDEELS